MLQSFSAKRFRNLNIDNLQFNRVNVLVGPNNSGKSNFIDAISFFANLIRKDKDQLYPTALWNELHKRGWRDLLDRNEEEASTIEMNWVLTNDLNKQDDLTYEIRIQVPQGTNSPPEDFHIVYERLANAKPKGNHPNPYEFFKCHEGGLGKGKFVIRKTDQKPGGKSQQKTLDVDPNDTVMNQITQLLNNKEFRSESYPNFMRGVEPVQLFFEHFRSYSSTSFDLQKLRQGEREQSYAKFLKADGSNLASVLDALEKLSPGFLQTYANKLSQLVHDLLRIDVHSPQDGNLKYIILTIGGKEFKLSEMSDGTLKAMILALLLWTPESSSLLSLDEPELNIHPAWLKVVAQWIYSANSAKQIFLSTHSPELLDGLTEMFVQGELNLFTFSLKKDSMIKQIMPEQIQHWLDDEWELGDIYRAGKLGGWPW